LENSLLAANSKTASTELFRAAAAVSSNRQRFSS
jgi:hypothetical protein